MSERGSFVTEYVYCDECFEKIKPILLDRVKYLCSVVIPSWSEHEPEGLPIIAGKIGGGYLGEELVEFEYKIAPEIAKVICHPLRVAVISDSRGEQIFTIEPAQPDNARQE